MRSGRPLAPPVGMPNAAGSRVASKSPPQLAQQQQVRIAVEALRLQRQRQRLAAQRQAADCLRRQAAVAEAELRGAKHGLRMRLAIEQLGTAQPGIEHPDAGADGARVDADLDARAAAEAIELDFALRAMKRPRWVDNPDTGSSK